ncbi:Serine/threonine protein kinase [Phytophthora cinnamomi]|uniref:Serine/threonine protein kinase n=1 Tax=Phytophthora cinnamomi TaxID=4785 RepID=UPI00355A5503|nr:Serine/threonine protein kinase [Phytophthora cinnamomi]
MSIALLDLFVPGSGVVLEALNTLWEYCGEMNEGKDVCKRLHRRLKGIFDELQKMEKKGQLPSNNALDEYVSTISKSLGCLDRYRKMTLVFRLISHQEMLGELCQINEEIDELFGALNLATTASLMDWKQKWETDQRVMYDMMASLVSDSAQVMRELQSTRAQLEAMMVLKYETEQRSERQTKGSIKLMTSMMGTVVRATSTTVAKLPPWFMSTDEVKFEKEAFARGSFASVHRGVWGPGTRVVVKCFLNEDIVADERAKQQIEKEINLWYKFNNPNVIRMFGASHVSSPAFVVCEDATNGDLCSYLARSESNKQHMWRLLYQAALGLDHIHRKSVVHGDLKLNNILVGADGLAKLSDFGLSAVRNTSNSKTAAGAAIHAGALRWRAPECLKKSPTFASDVYSFAMCMVEAVIGAPPFASLDDDSVRELLKHGEIPERPDDMPDEAWNLVVSMTNVDATKRVSLTQALAKLKALADDEANNYGLESAPMTSELAYNHVKLSGSASSSNSRLKNTNTSFADLLVDLGEADDIKQEKILFQLARKCVNVEQREPMYEEENRIEIVTSFVRNGPTYFAKLYALQCLKWAVISDAKVSQEDFDALRDCVQEAQRSEIAAVVSALQNGTTEEKEEAAVRCACIATRANGDRLRDAGSKSSFTALLRSNSESKLCAGMVQPLITLLQTGNDMQKIWTAEALGDLAMENETIRSEILRGNAIKTLVALLKVGTSEQKHRAAYTLGSLAYSKDGSAKIVQKEAVSLLIALLLNGTDEQKHQAACTLGRIALSKGASDKLVQEGSIAPLIALVQSGGVALLVELLRGGEDDQKENAASALGNAAVKEDISDEIALQNGVEALVELMRSGTDTQKENAASAIRNLVAVSDAHCTVVVDEEGIPLLIQLLEDESGKMQENAAAVLNSLASDSEACETISNKQELRPPWQLWFAAKESVKGYETALSSRSSNFYKLAPISNGGSPPKL